MAEATAEVSTLHKPNPALIVELENLLAEARAGTLRGMLFVAYAASSGTYRFGNSGDYGLPEFALGLKLMEHDLNTIIDEMRIGEGEKD